jgi:hypothetical protein
LRLVRVERPAREVILFLPSQSSSREVRGSRLVIS